MPLLLERPVQGAKTHAFVVGVGDYPHAKPNQGVRKELRNVPDLPSAADSAKLVCDWLLQNQDRLAAPLATLDALISDPDAAANRYPWAHGPVERVTEANMKTRGRQWYERVIAERGDVALFYCCGHGASHLEQPVLFTEDLNLDPGNPWSHINLGSLAQTLRRDQDISAAFLFADTCGEFVPALELSRATGCQFFHALDPFAVSHNQVSLLCAAAGGQFAYEDTPAPGDPVKFGRFTLALLKGLDGSSARSTGNRWSVSCRDLLDDLKSLRRIYFDHWKKNAPFEPYPAVTQTDRIPIIFHPDGIEVPVVVMTNPLNDMPLYSLCVSKKNDPASPWLDNRNAGFKEPWLTKVPASSSMMYVIAMRESHHCVQVFQPKEPLFEQWVNVP